MDEKPHNKKIHSFFSHRLTDEWYSQKIKILILFFYNDEINVAGNQAIFNGYIT